MLPLYQCQLLSHEIGSPNFPVSLLQNTTLFMTMALYYCSWYLFWHFRDSGLVYHFLLHFQFAHLAIFGHRQPNWAIFWSQRVINFTHFLILQREILWKLIVLIHILIQFISTINHGEKAVLASLSAFFTLPHSRLEIEWGPVEWISCGFLSHFPGACPQAPTTRVPHSRLRGRARNSGTRDTRLLKGLMCKGHLLKEEIL